MQLSYEHNTGRFVAYSSYDERFVLKDARFRWSPEDKVWWTQDWDRAALFIHVADSSAKAVLQSHTGHVEKEIAASQALAPISENSSPIPCPEGQEYLPFQIAAIHYMVDHPAVLNGDDMRLGKTIDTAGVINADPTISSVLIICPATMVLNWRNELDKWLIHPRSIAPLISKAEELPPHDIVIMSFARAWKLYRELRARSWDMIVVDEAHRLKTRSSQRARAVFGFEPTKKEREHPNRAKRKEPIPALDARRKVLLSGTPYENRPKEIFPLVHWLLPEVYPNFFRFALQYCAAYQDKYGWNFDGSSNLEALQAKLRSTCMIRRRFFDVFAELPPIRRQVIEIPIPNKTVAKLVSAELEEFEEREARLAPLRAAMEAALEADDRDGYASLVAELAEARKVAFDQMSRVRRETAEAMLPFAIDHLDDLLDGQKVVAFAHHRDVVNGIADHFGKHSARIMGGMEPKKVETEKARFQTDDDCTLMVANILAGGLGHRLDAADLAVFVELDWVPGNVNQAEMRLMSKDKKSSILVQQLVFEGSLGAKMARTLVEKQEVMDRGLDEGLAEWELAKRRKLAKMAERVKLTKKNGPESPSDERSAPRGGGSTPEKPISAPAFTEAQAQAIHEGLRSLAGMCDGARVLDGAGFNKMDADFGRALAMMPFLTPRQLPHAAKLIRKYHRQLPDEIVKQAKGD